jgi:hypothetical protein
LMAAALGSFAVLFGCGNDDFREFKTLGPLKILTLVASTPEVSPGATVTITPVVSDSNGAGRTITAEAFACPDPGVSFGATPTCSGVAGAQTITIGGGATYTLAAPTHTGTGNTFTVTVPSTLLSAYTTAQALVGVAYIVTYKVTAGNEVQEAFRRIVVSTNPTKNTKPTLSNVLVGGTALTQLPTTGSALIPNISAGSAETYTALSGDGTPSAAQEILTSTWFVSKGSISSTRTELRNSNFYTPSGGSSDAVVVVTRDNRGGASYCILTPTTSTCG